mgnify:CR=1 FL=1
MDQNNDSNSHKTILKATSVFGGMQLAKMGVSIVSLKFVAVFLGPIGMGIVGLLTNTINIISAVTSFGFSTTSIREIANATGKVDSEKRELETIYLVQKIALGVGVFGALIAIVFSSQLSQLTFGSTDKYYWFLMLSVNFVFTSYTTSRIAILQGKRMLKMIAISNIISSILISISSVLIYYFLRLDGIVVVLLMSSAINWGVNWYCTRNFKTQSIHLGLPDIWKKSLPILKLGFLLSINVIFGYICTFIIKIYLNSNGATSAILGFYEVSTVILISYVGMIFNAMSMDFYPRLTSLNDDHIQMKKLTNNQIEIALLLLTPAILFLYLVAPYMIELLYSKDFLAVNTILKVGLFAMIIKAVIWPLGFIILAKGDKKQYFIQELLGDFLNVSFTILFYNYFGLVGIGFASALNFSLYGFYVYYVVNKKYDFSFRKECITIVVFSILVGLLSCFSVLFLSNRYALITISILLFFSLLFSYCEIDKRVGVKRYVLKIKNKFLK